MINEIKKDQADRKAQILSAFKNVENDPRAATVITKADFEDQYPEAKFERYSLSSLTKFREELNKSEDVDNKDAAFVEATKDFKHFLVVHNGVRAAMFVREKVSGE